jgi:maleylacetoacetate isomerase
MITLYSYYRSSSSYRIRLALNIKGLDYEIKPIHLIKDGGEQHSAQFKKLNAAEKIPLIDHVGYLVAQSMAIVEYLEETFPDQPRLFPTQLADRARVRQLCEIVNSDIQPLQNLSVLQKLVGDYGFSEEQKLEWCQHWIRRGLESFEALLKVTHGRYCHKDQVGVADCFLIPQVYNAQRYGIDLSQFPLITQINENCMELEAFSMAHPDNQPDTPR